MSAKCPICEKTFSKKDEIVSHVMNKHQDEIPKGMSAAQYIYMLNHNGRKNGICRYCGEETPWNEKTGKPYQLCGKPECKEKNAKIAQQRMIKTYGKPTLLTDPKHQEKMLAGRKISGTYIWSDGVHKFTYTGTYEKYAIEWMDKVMDMDPESIQMPGLILPYMFEGEEHAWITDMYLPEFNLIVEIKDGNENKNPEFEINRAKEAAKDESMKRQTNFNYAKITHRNMMQLVKVMTDIKNNNLMDSSDTKSKKVIVINESAISEKKPLGKQRITQINGVSGVRMLKGEASGYSKRKEEIFKFLETPEKVFITSDVHIAKYDNSPDVYKIASFINDRVSEDDLIIFAGDVVTPKDNDKETKRLTKILLEQIINKKVVLVLGNNDNLSVNDYYECGFWYVTDYIDNGNYLISHFPEHIAGEKFNIHGHIHGVETIWNTSCKNHIDVFYEKYDKIHNLKEYLDMYANGAYDYMITYIKGE